MLIQSYFYSCFCSYFYFEESSNSSNNYPKTLTESVLRTLQQNRSLFDDATSKHFNAENPANCVSTDFETDNNYGFSMSVPEGFEYEFDEPVSVYAYNYI